MTASDGDGGFIDVGGDDGGCTEFFSGQRQDAGAAADVVNDVAGL